METLTLYITRPFSQKTVQVEWVSIVSPNGTFIVGPGHQPHLSLITPGNSIVYRAAGAEHPIDVVGSGGILHVTSAGARLVLE